MVTDDLGPQPLGRQERARIYSGLSGQRHPTDSTRGLDHLLPPGLGKTGHMAASATLPSPFRVTDWPEHDVTFVLEAVCLAPVLAGLFIDTSGASFGLWRQPSSPWKMPSTLGRWRVLTVWPLPNVPGFVAVLTLLLRWPRPPPSTVSRPRIPYRGTDCPDWSFPPCTVP